MPRNFQKILGWQKVFWSLYFSSIGEEYAECIDEDDGFDEEDEYILKTSFLFPTTLMEVISMLNEFKCNKVAE